jgi:hypothetical protein
VVSKLQSLVEELRRLRGVEAENERLLTRIAELEKPVAVEWITPQQATAFIPYTYGAIIKMVERGQLGKKPNTGKRIYVSKDEVIEVAALISKRD